VLADGTVEDICGYLNHTELVRLRPRLWLPKHSGEHFVPWTGIDLRQLLAQGLSAATAPVLEAVCERVASVAPPPTKATWSASGRLKARRAMCS
jgi:hypothetical protein